MPQERIRSFSESQGHKENVGVLRSLFVFSIDGLKQKAMSLLTPFSDTDFHPLLHGSLHFVLHGSSNNHLFQRL